VTSVAPRATRCFECSKQFTTAFSSTFHQLGFSPMCAHHESSTIPRWEILPGKCASRSVRGYSFLTPSAFLVSQSSSSSSNRSPSDLEGVDIAVIGSLSKRKAALLPAGSQRTQKVARTDTTHRPGRSMKETEATSRTQGAFESRASTTSPIAKKKRRRVSLMQNRELMRSILKPGPGTFTISSLSGCRDMLVSR
jgi:hypothetical protein